MQTREELVQGLRRRFFGPRTNSTTDRAWPGLSVQPKVVNMDFDGGGAYPIGPWVSDAGEEVLNVNPLTLYVVGVLLPEMTEEVQAAALAESQSVSEEVDQTDEPSTQVDMEGVGVRNGVEVEAGDSFEGEVFQAGSQALALSFRVTKFESDILARLQFGYYEQFDVPKARHKRWWVRRDSVSTFAFAPSQSEVKRVHVGDVAFDVGIEFRDDRDESRICTLWIQNRGDSSSFVEAAKRAMFQVALSAEVNEILPYRHDTDSSTSLDLLYREKEVFAVGHGCDVRVERSDVSWVVESDSLPVVEIAPNTPDVTDESGNPLGVGMADLALLNNEARAAIERLIAKYATWIDQRDAEVDEIPAILQPIARNHVEQCRQFLVDIRAGWLLVQSNSVVRECLCASSQAMNNQRRAVVTKRRQATVDGSEISFVEPIEIEAPQSQGMWRPFQIAFILASLPRFVSDEDEKRNSVDVIWMPTGGGKTEAYLGLAAFVILWQRRSTAANRGPSRHSTKVFMRYTLRLLTVQQFTRAASLICALELIRRERPEIYGSNEVRIGAWLGSKVTFTKRKNAVDAYDRRLKQPNERGFLLKMCPWCGAEMGDVRENQILGYRKVKIPGKADQRVFAACPDSRCPFSHRKESGKNGKVFDRGLPVLEVDEDIYDNPPDFLLATIDKLARISWRPDAQAIFGLSGGRRKNPAPSLLIQDELHLVNGPLGSIDGLYEVLIDHLCSIDGGKQPVVVGATATTKGFVDQVRSLYGRESRLVPPPGLSIDDSFFAKRVEDGAIPSKIYVGLCSSSLAAAVKTQTAALGAVAHFAPSLERDGHDVDPYWTNIVFFSSRRALGRLSSDVESSLHSQISRMRSLSGVNSGRLEGTSVKATRSIGRLRELTAASSEDVTQVLEDLKVPRHDKKSIDLCFATSMIEVGLDVSRLGLMTVIGQPKSASQYIQVTGRVGRSKDSPGLVLCVLNPWVARDKAHYEGFRAWHSRLYASVENASITPFAGPALARTIQSTLVAFARIFGPAGTVRNELLGVRESFENLLAERASRFGALEVARVRTEIEFLYRKIDQDFVDQCKWDTEIPQRDDPRPPFVFRMAEGPLMARPHLNALSSMRNVDQDANFVVREVAPVSQAKPKDVNPVNDEDEESW